MQFSILKGHTFPEAQGVCVVIDVLRAFTTAAFAFASGAKEIIFVSTLEEAFHKYRSDPSLLLMGEQKGIPIEGFHFENSPYEMQNAAVSGRTLIQRTSSGTQGVVGCGHASHILISSFVVADATIKRILEINPEHVSFIVTGQTNGDEDLALAEYLRDRLIGRVSNPEHYLERVRTSLCAKRMKSGPISYTHGERDLQLATHIDFFPFAMEVFKSRNELVGKAVHFAKM